MQTIMDIYRQKENTYKAKQQERKNQPQTEMHSEKKCRQKQIKTDVHAYMKTTRQPTRKQ